MAKAAVLLPRQEMQQMATDLIAQYPNLSPFCIEYTHTDAACQRAIRLQNDGCELILARGLDTSGDITLTEEFIRRTRDVDVPYRPSLPTPAGAARDGFVHTMTAAGLL